MNYRMAPENDAARKIAVASLCAHEQGKFLAFRQLLLEEPGERTAERLPQFARQLGLQESDFSKCLKSGRFQSAVAEHEAEYKRNMLEGQPSWLVNGFAFGGALTAEEFQGVVQSMLDGVYL